MVDQQYHFISGLPRSGSTLLSALLRQNPAFEAGITGPAASLVMAMLRGISQGSEAASFLTENHRRNLLRHAVTDCHGEAPVVFDTNRAWASRMPLLAELFPDFRMVCCVRPVGEIVDSIEALTRRNPLELSGIFDFQPGGTVYDRAQALTQGGLVGSAMACLRDGFLGPLADRMMLIEFEALTAYPAEALAQVYDFLELPRFDGHDLNDVRPIPGAAEFDIRMGTPGLHDLRPTVAPVSREPVLPQDILNSFGEPFWRQGSPRAKVVRLAPRKE